MKKSQFIVYKITNLELLLPGTEKTIVATIDGTKRAAQKWVAFGGVIPSHIGEMRRFASTRGYIYYTTIGTTYIFERVIL